MTKRTLTRTTYKADTATSERGAAMVEYGLLLAIFVMVVLTALPAFNFALSGADTNSRTTAQLYQAYPRPLL